MHSLIFAICFFASSSLLFSACKTTKPIEELTDADIRIKMSKGGCFGKCPIYSIEIYEGGYTKYYGEKHAEKLGIYDKQLSKESYKTIIKSFENADFFGYKDFYETKVPDAPSVSISYRNKDSEIKTIEGKLNRPKPIKELQVLIENIASSKDWNVIEKMEKEAKTEKEDGKVGKVIKSEIIIEPKSDIALTKWFSKKKELYGVRIINKIAPNLNLWLITYDEKMVDGDMLLQILQNDPHILNAEFNKKTTSRGQ